MNPGAGCTEGHRKVVLGARPEDGAISRRLALGARLKAPSSPVYRVRYVRPSGCWTYSVLLRFLITSSPHPAVTSFPIHCPPLRLPLVSFSVAIVSHLVLRLFQYGCSMRTTTIFSPPAPPSSAAHPFLPLTSAVVALSHVWPLFPLKSGMSFADCRKHVASDMPQYTAGSPHTPSPHIQHLAPPIPHLTECC